MARKRTNHRTKGEGSHWYDKKNKRHVWYIECDGKRYTATDREEERAKAKFEVLKRQLSGDIDIDGSKQLLRVYLPRYIDSEVAPHMKMSTTHDYHKRADYYILPTLGDYPLCDLKRSLIVAWVKAMLIEPDKHGKLWSINSIKQALRLLKRALDAAVAEHLLEDNPAASVKVPTRRKGDEFKIDEGQPQAKTFSPEELAIFMAEVERTERFHGNTIYYKLKAELGWRRGEGLGLRVKDLDRANKIMYINQQVIRLDNEIYVTTPKTESGRRGIPITDDNLALFDEQCRRVGAIQPDDYVFPDKKGQRRRPDSITLHFRRVCDRLQKRKLRRIAELEAQILTAIESVHLSQLRIELDKVQREPDWSRFTLHSLRKYAITDMRRHGGDLEVIAAIAGHKGTGITAEIYSDPQMDRKRSIVEKGRKTE